MISQLSFSVEAAKVHGVEGAVLLSHIVYWVYRNQLNKQNEIDGMYWTYNTAESFAQLFPFWKPTKIRRLLNKLENENAILIGCYNKAKYDRTKWYAITKHTQTLYSKHYSNFNNALSKNEDCIIQNSTLQSTKADNLYHITKQITTQITTKEKVVMPFEGDKFAEAWQMWKQYKKVEKNFRFKSYISEQASLINLQKISNNNEQDAITIIHTAVAQGWSGLYAGKKAKGEKGFDKEKYSDYLNTL